MVVVFKCRHYTTFASTGIDISAYGKVCLPSLRLILVQARPVAYLRHDLMAQTRRQAF